MKKKKSDKIRHYINNKDFVAALVEYKEICAKAKGNKPAASDYIGKCIMQICEKLSRKSNFGQYCVDEETEALTQRGWLKYNEITLNDIILSYDIETKNLVWSTILDLYKGAYDGLMFKIDGSTIDALVTPHHKFVTREHGLVQVEDLLVKDHLVTMGNPVEQTYKKYDNAFVELVGWFVTEGNIATYLKKKNNELSYYISISQSKKVNSNKCDRINDCIVAESDPDLSYVRTPHKIEEDGGTTYQVDRELSKKLVEVAPDKVLSMDFIIALTQEQKELLIDTMIDGDGSYAGRNRDIPQYFQKDKKHIDAFLILCTLAGYTTDVYYREWKTGFCDLSKGYLVTLTKRKECYLEKVDFHGGKRGVGGRWINKTKFHQPTVQYKGIVWCPQTEYGTWICRRNKKIYGTSNTYRDEMYMDAIESCVHALGNFDIKKTENAFGYFTMVAWTAMVRRILAEKKQNAIKHKNYQQQYRSSELEGELGLDQSNNEYSNRIIEEFETRLNNKPLTKTTKKVKITKIKEKK